MILNARRRKKPEIKLVVAATREDMRGTRRIPTHGPNVIRMPSQNVQSFARSGTPYAHGLVPPGGDKLVAFVGEGDVANPARMPLQKVDLLGAGDGRQRLMRLSQLAAAKTSPSGEKATALIRSW